MRRLSQPFVAGRNSSARAEALDAHALPRVGGASAATAPTTTHTAPTPHHAVDLTRHTTTSRVVGGPLPTKALRPSGAARKSMVTLLSPEVEAAAAEAASTPPQIAPSAAPHDEVEEDAVEEESSEVLAAEGSTCSNSNAFTDQETKYFRKMFDMFDTDHSGAIGFFEMKNLTRHLGVQVSDEQLKVSMDRIDENGNGELEFEEFMQWLSNVNSNVDGEGDEFAVVKSKIRAQGARPLSSSQIEQFKQVFRHFDADGSGTIDIEELGNVFEAMGQTLSTEELQSVLRHADDDGSGEIDFDEFLMLMCCSFGAEKSFEADLMETFRRYDVDADGLVSTRDLRQLVLELVGDTMTAEEVDEVVEVAAVERGDGYVDFMKWESLWDACRGAM